MTVQTLLQKDNLYVKTHCCFACGLQHPCPDLADYRDLWSEGGVPSQSAVIEDHEMVRTGHLPGLSRWIPPASIRMPDTILPK